MEKIIIIGAGPAGISAALYAARANMDPLVINNGIGALEKAEKIENYYGMEHPVSGKELFETGLAQAKALGVRILEAQVLGIGGFDTFTVKTTAGDFDTISVILATGSKRKAPAIPGIKELEGRGVSYCAVCDGFFYRQKEVAVLGNGPYALHEARVLEPLAKKVTILTNGSEPAFAAEELGSIRVEEKKILSARGDTSLSHLEFEDHTLFPLDGLFVALGTADSTDIARKLGLFMEDNHILIEKDTSTALPGLFAAGDCTGGLLQISKAVYEGALAGTKAVDCLRKELQ